MIKSRRKWITGLFKMTRKNPKDPWQYLISGRNLNYDNIHYFGENTLLLILKNKNRKGPGSPEFALFAVDGGPLKEQKEVWWEDVKE